MWAPDAADKIKAQTGAKAKEPAFAAMAVSMVVSSVAASPREAAVVKTLSSPCFSRPASPRSAGSPDPRLVSRLVDPKATTRGAATPPPAYQRPKWSSGPALMIASNRAGNGGIASNPPDSQRSLASSRCGDRDSAVTCQPPARRRWISGTGPASPSVPRWPG